MTISTGVLRGVQGAHAASILPRSGSGGGG